jgi:hypothetical protein
MDNTNQPNNNKTTLGRFIVAPHYLYLFINNHTKCIEVYEKVEFITHEKFKNTLCLEELIIPLN